MRGSDADRLQAAGLLSLVRDGKLIDTALENITTPLGEWAKSLNGSTPLEVETDRAQLVVYGFPARMVDAALKTVRSEKDNGQGLFLKDSEPWPEPVDGAALLVETVATFERFLALPEGAAVVMALWTLHAHAHDAFSISPYLAFTSAVRGSGKTSALTIVHALTPRALFGSNLTAASVFRTIEKHGPTLLIDEADTFLRDRDDLRGVLNAGHFRAGATVVRLVGDDHEPKAFSVWCPKAVAKIGELPPTLADRSLVIRMRRRRPDEQVERIRLDKLHDGLNPFRRRAARWADDNLDTLRDADPVIPEKLRDRQADNARPLLAIADLAGGEWPDTARRAILRFQSRDVDNEEAGVLLLADLRDLFAARGDRLRTADILRNLTGREDRPWGEWRRGQSLSGISLSQLLRRFGIRPKSIRFETNVGKGYERADFEDSFARYLPASPPPSGYTGNNPQKSATKSESSTGYIGRRVTGWESGGAPHKSAIVTGVTGQDGGLGEDEAYLRAEREGMQCG